jgi:hypothetical protein
MKYTDHFLLCLTPGAALLWLVIALPAHAACNNSKNWLDAPGTDAEMRIQDGVANRIIPDGLSTGLGLDDAYPVRITMNLLNKSVNNRLVENGGDITYYELDGKGSWRICRKDGWAANANLTNSPQKLIAQRLSQQYRSTASKLKKVTEGYWLSTSTQYFYDAKGRIERVSHWYFEDGISGASDQICQRYDDKDRILLAVDPWITKTCPAGQPDLRDRWLQYKYGEFNGETIPLLVLGHNGQADGSWSEKFDPFRLSPSPDAVWGHAEADSKKGVSFIFGSNLGKLDDNAANTVVDSFGRWTGSTYSFTKPPVPLAVLEKPELIYQYERRRQTYVDGQIVKLFELFKPNQHVPQDRYYMIDGFVLRHEQLNAAGIVTRVITIEDWRQPRPGPTPDVNDKLLSHHEVALMAHKVFHRVYDMDANRRPKLVAVSWDRAIRLNPKKKIPIDMADLVYGTPDGKERWKTEAEFEKKFRTSSHAAHVFPVEQREVE